MADTIPRAVVALLTALAVASLAPAVDSSASAQTPPVRTVLAVYCGSADTRTNAATNTALHAALLSRPDLAIDYYAEYLESDRLPEVASQALRDYIIRKYGHRRIDLVIALADSALQFVLRDREALFPDSPIVYAGVAAPDASVRNAGAGITGVVSGAALRETVELALKLHPSTERVVVLEAAGGTNPLRSELTTLAGRVDLRYVNQASVPRLLDEVRAIPAGSVVLFIRPSQTAGQRLRPVQVAGLVTEASKVPVYSISDDFIGTGIVGTAGISVQDLGTRVGGIALRILDGARPQEIPLVERPRRPVFDWRQVQRWNIDPSLLPPGSDIRFREPTAWELYRSYIVGAAVVFAFQALTITSLMFQRARRRETEARNAAILRAVPDMMFLQSRDGVYLDYHAPSGNRTFAPPDQFLGRHMRDVLPSEVASMFSDHFVRLTPGQAPTVVEYALQMPDGECQFEARLVPCNDDQVLSIVRDITQRKQAERALHEAQTELTRVSRLTAIGEFAASVAHEIRQPLTAIVVNARTCLRWLGGAAPDLGEVRAALSDVVDAGQRADDIIRRNRELFRHHTVHKAPLDMNAVIREVAVLAGARLQNSRCSLTMSLDPGVAVVAGDGVELQQVLLNLIVNAIDAMDGNAAASRRIEIISSASEGNAVQVAVRDNGVGLEGVDMRRMFTSTYTTKAHGTGVGLSISRSIIHAHGGQLWAEQNLDRGATFYFTLPVESMATLTVDLPGR